jgi:hypothetical protein
MELAEPDGWAAIPVDMPLAGIALAEALFPMAAVEDGAWPASFAPYGTEVVLHAVSTPVAPRTPAPSSTQRRVAH